jgi:hypothetical protein
VINDLKETELRNWSQIVKERKAWKEENQNRVGLKRQDKNKNKKRDNRCLSENHTPHITASAGRNVQFMNLETGDVGSYHGSLTS